MPTSSCQTSFALVGIGTSGSGAAASAPGEPEATTTSVVDETSAYIPKHSFCEDHTKEETWNHILVIEMYLCVNSVAATRSISATLISTASTRVRIEFSRLPLQSNLCFKNTQMYIVHTITYNNRRRKKVSFRFFSVLSTVEPEPGPGPSHRLQLRLRTQ